MRLVRWGALFLLVALHLLMEAPVWHLITRVDVIGGSTGYHRYRLIDAAVRYSHEWIVIGTTGGTAHWGPQLRDVTNYYLVQGLNGGIVQLLIFLAILGWGFRDAGRIVCNAGSDRSSMILGWALGVSLFVHCTSFVGVSYFGQILPLFYLTLATIGSLAGATSVTRPFILKTVPARRAIPDSRPPVRRPEPPAECEHDLADISDALADARPAT
jgi:hypothetical protein